MDIIVTGIDEVQRFIKKVDEAIKPDIRKMGEVAKVLLDAVDNNFATNGHGTWAAKASSSRAGLGPLQLKGKMRRSMEPKVGTNYAEAKLKNVQGTFKTKVQKYGAIHNFGSQRITARPFAQLWPEDQDATLETYIKPLDDVMK